MRASSRESVEWHPCFPKVETATSFIWKAATSARSSYVLIRCSLRNPQGGLPTNEENQELGNEQGRGPAPIVSTGPIAFEEHRDNFSVTFCRIVRYQKWPEVSEYIRRR